MIFITTYKCPDIDGIACTLGYLEFLKAQKQEAKVTFVGDLSREVEFFKEYTGYFPAARHKGRYPDGAEFVLVDTADPDAIESTIPLEKVTTVFDHRELVFSGKFTKARLKIEKVGSCATLIVELLQRKKITPSKNVAVYLYSAIISNTVRFKNSVTTSRDIAAAKYLKLIARIPNSYVERMFEFKSRIKRQEDLLFLLNQDFVTHQMKGRGVMIAQVEIAELEEVVNKNLKAIQIWLKKTKREEKLDYALFTGIDINKGFNLFITVDKKSDEFFSRVLGVSKINGQLKQAGIIMRKQIWPKVEKIINICSAV